MPLPAAGEGVAEPQTPVCDCPALKRRGSADTLHILQKPVADEVDAELAVVDLAMLGAAFGFGEDLQRLVLRADPLVELLRLRERHDAVVLAMQDQDRALDLLGHAFEREFLRPFQRGCVVGRADHPAELEGRAVMLARGSVGAWP